MLSVSLCVCVCLFCVASESYSYQEEDDDGIADLTPAEPNFDSVLFSPYASCHTSSCFHVSRGENR